MVDVSQVFLSREEAEALQRTLQLHRRSKSASTQDSDVFLCTCCSCLHLCTSYRPALGLVVGLPLELDLVLELALALEAGLEVAPALEAGLKLALTLEAGLGLALALEPGLGLALALEAGLKLALAGLGLAVYQQLLASHRLQWLFG